MSMIRSLKSHELENMYDLLARSFTKTPTSLDSRKERHKKVIESDPFLNYELNRVVEVDGKLVARIGIYDRTMLFEGRELRIGAIGGVCTDPEYRGRGFAKQLLEDCTIYMKENNFDASLLFGNPLIYEKSGWETLSTFGLSTNFDLDINCKSELREADFKNDLDWLSSIYNKYVVDMTGPFKRTRGYWEKWINGKVEHRKKHNIHIVEKNGTKLGYFSSGLNNIICEIGWDRYIDGSCEETIAAVFSYVKDEIISFRFFTQEIFDFICCHSVAPGFDMLENETFFIRKDAIYSGLFKLIDGKKAGVESTSDFNRKLRTDNYIFWDMDHF